MIKATIAFILAIHGLIHLLGFIKAFKFAEVKQLTQPITKELGLLWLASFILFIVTAILFLSTHYNYWWVFCLAGIALSQLLIVNAWQDAKFGTLANLLLLIATIMHYLD